jgi:hypothetical protein
MANVLIRPRYSNEYIKLSRNKVKEVRSKPRPATTFLSSLKKTLPKKPKKPLTSKTQGSIFVVAKSYRVMPSALIRRRLAMVAYEKMASKIVPDINRTKTYIQNTEKFQGVAGRGETKSHQLESPLAREDI